MTPGGFRHRRALPGRALAALAIAASALLAAVGVPGGTARAEPTDANVTIDGRDVGRTYSGIGAVSAGASSRLLYDYPEPARSRILDYLFKPGYGASLELLKVEIGGGMNSTDGSEPSHMREPGEVNCGRGYEWWLMKQAKKRNPDITLLGLQWGAPGWFEGGFWSQDNIDYLLAWLGCAEQHGLKIDYMGGWNERGYDAGWFVEFDRALEKHYPYVKLVGADECCRKDLWGVAETMQQNQAFKEAVDVVGVHFACGHRSQYKHCPSPRFARELGEPLWISENSALAHNVGAAPLARALNRMYIDGRMTGYMTWSLISSWYANLPIGDTGIMLAEWPWSGYYEVGKSVWSFAHTTQFTEPGWRYLNTGSGRLDSGGTYVTMKSPSGEDYSTIVETMDATRPTTVRFEVTGGLPDDPIQVWSTDLRSDKRSDHFVHTGAVEPHDGAYTVTLQPGHVYSLSTTTGQGKGGARPPADIHQRMELPYAEDFEGLERGDLARYFSDVNGAFEAVPCAGERSGTCYRQMTTRQPIVWNDAGTMDPTTIVGDPRWWGDYQVSAEFLLEDEGYVELLGRVSTEPVHGPSLGGYHLRVASDGGWKLYSEDPARGTHTLASGTADIGTGSWHGVRLRMRGDELAIYLDGERVATVDDGRQRTGNVGLAVSKWDNAQFDEVKVTRTAPRPHFVPQEEMSATATSHHGFYRGWTYPAAKAIDDRPETYWHSEFGPRLPLPQAITLDLGDVHDVQGLAVQPRYGDTSAMITRYNVYVSVDGENFRKVGSGSWPVSSATKIASWDGTVEARYVRLEATGGVKDLASAAEINVATAGPPLAG